jgi:hypothetical protein
MASDVRRPGSQWRAAGSAPVRWIGTTWHGPLSTIVMGESTPMQRSDRWSLWCLGVRTRRGYSTYGGAPTWPRVTSRQSALRRSKAISICRTGFQTRFSLNFETKLHPSPNSKDADQVSLFKIYKGR